VKRVAETLRLDVRTPERLKPFAGEAGALAPDAFVVASYGRIVPQALLDLVPIAFNIHPSLLPLYRGATPLQSVLRDGRDETGVTIIAMDAGMDTGDVLLQERIAITPGETYGALHDRTARIGASLVAQALDGYDEGTLVRRSQRELTRELGIDEAEIARTATRPWTKEDWILDPTRGSAAMVDLVRALAPEPGARLAVPPLGTLRILAARVDPRGPRGAGELRAAAIPGTLVPSGADLFVRSADGWVAIERLVPPGRTAMSAREFLSGYGRHLAAAAAGGHSPA
jgi:methionyl-tRNA formyltransferase